MPSLEFIPISSALFSFFETSKTNIDQILWIINTNVSDLGCFKLYSFGKKVTYFVSKYYQEESMKLLTVK